MTARPLALTASVALTLGVAMSGCSVDSSSGADSRPGKPRWTCTWSPTMDDDWHDDALCTDGIRTERPHLRPQDAFVEQAELMASARAWARRRNGG